MPYRTTPFVNDHYYHIYNRGSEKKPIFQIKWDYKRFLKTIKYYQLEGPKPRLSKFLVSPTFKPDLNKKIVGVICYCLMPNHFHFLLKQTKEGGISEFMRKLSNSYTKYYNTKHDRIGPLLQGEFKAVLVASDEQLLHLSRYIHLNPLVSYVTNDLDLYPWSSHFEYVNNTEGLCDKSIILEFFKKPSDYQKFVIDQASYGQELELIKHQLIDEH